MTFHHYINFSAIEINLMRDWIEDRFYINADQLFAQDVVNLMARKFPGGIRAFLVECYAEMGGAQ